MPRMRTIKPEACTSETLAEVPRAVRWTFACLWTHCDDSGRATWNPRLIKAAIYPLDDDVTVDVIVEEIGELVRVGAVCCYEIDGRSYLHIPSWTDHQHPNRPQESKLPGCPRDHSESPRADSTHGRGTDGAVNGSSPANQGPTAIPGSFTEPSVNAHGALTPVVVGEGQVLGEGEGAARTRARAVHDSPPTAQTIVAEWIDRDPSRKRPPGQVVGQVARHVGKMLDEGIDPDDIRRGLKLWMGKGLNPSSLPSVVYEAMTARASPGKASSKASGWLALAGEANR